MEPAAPSPPPAINPPHRRAYAELLRQFMSGRMTNFEYENRFNKLESRFGPDDTVWAVYLRVWECYCDLRKHRMTDPGRRLPPEMRLEIARWIVFLHTDQAGLVPPSPSMSSWKAVLWLLEISAMLVSAVMQPLSILLWPLKIWVVTRLAGSEPTNIPPPDTAIWPFRTPDDYYAALGQPRLLARAS